MLALRRAREAASPPILRGAFRPFFFGAAGWAAVALGLWLLVLGGSLQLPSHFDPLAWHRHEMLFGFVGAAVSGFLLTAVPNWTGRLPVAGWPLACLFALWVAARAAVFFSAQTGAVPALVLDVGYFVLLAGLAAREVRSAVSRNAPLVGLVLLFAAANALDHGAAFGLIRDPELGIRAGLGLVVMMMSVVGGRIIPSFTRNWLARRQVRSALPGQPGRFDRLVLAATAMALLAWIGAAEARATGLLLTAAAALQAARLARWRGHRCATEPFLLILHVGYAWIPIGLALLGARQLGGDLPVSAAIHTLTAGAMASLILGVMTRSTLSYTARPLKAGPGTILIYVAITAAALIRVTLSFGGVDYALALRLSGLAWSVAFGAFLLIYGPILWAPRMGEGRN